MAAIRELSDIAAKWANVTPQRSPDYEAGVRSPRKDWKAATAAANESYKTGLQASIAADSWVKGVNKAGTETWQEGSLTKGVDRWGPGVALAEPKYAEGFAPYRAAIAGLTLPPRFARRDPRNLNRVKAVVDAMIATKVAQR
jgi:hypothetical protein